MGNFRVNWESAASSKGCLDWNSGGFWYRARMQFAQFHPIRFDSFRRRDWTWSLLCLIPSPHCPLFVSSVMKNEREREKKATEKPRLGLHPLRRLYRHSIRISARAASSIYKKKSKGKKKKKEKRASRVSVLVKNFPEVTVNSSSIIFILYVWTTIKETRRIRWPAKKMMRIIVAALDDESAQRFFFFFLQPPIHSSDWSRRVFSSARRPGAATAAESRRSPSFDSYIIRGRHIR